MSDLNSLAWLGSDWRGNSMTNETHLILVADFGVLRYRSGSLHNVNSLIVISERNTVRNDPKGGTQKHSLVMDLHFSPLTPYFC